MSRDKSIRRGQAIQPYGPGAIIDVEQESFVMIDTRKNARAWKQGGVIRLSSLERRLGAHHGFRQPPSGSAFGSSRSGTQLLVKRFPAWMFCPRCRRMYRWSDDLEQRNAVENRGRPPSCHREECKGSTLVPMRYVAACPAGHLEDVDWFRWAHSRSSGVPTACSPTSPRLRFIADSAKGSSLKALRVECENCKASRDLEEVSVPKALTNIGQKCGGRQPWQSREEAVSCAQPLVTLLRSQTAVHFADIVSALDIDTNDASEANQIEQAVREHFESYTSVLPWEIVVESGRERETFEKLARQLSATAEFEIDADTYERVIADSAGTSGSSATPDPEADADPMRLEWQSLITSSPANGVSRHLRVAESDWRRDAEDSGLGRLLESVMLVERLREVRVMRGFRRVKPDGTLVRPDLYRGDGIGWLPAIEVYGEGILIRFDEAEIRRWESANSRFIEERVATARQRLEGSSWVTKRFEAETEVLPRFVMTHTFSHVLMRQLAFESGYSAASIRERLYVAPDFAGVLVYTADGDSEGSLGGLVRQGKADRISGTIASALTRAAWCSNDPICSEMPAHGLENLNRAACHACALVAETSCTHLNLLLDRALLIGDDGNGRRGFFAELLQTERGLEK